MIKLKLEKELLVENINGNKLVHNSDCGMQTALVSIHSLHALS